MGAIECDRRMQDEIDELLTIRVLGAEHGLGPLTPMEVGVYRSRESRGNKAVDGLYALLVKTLRLAG